jgi:uncharacterized Zn finger protein
MPVLKSLSFAPDISNRVYIKPTRYGFDEDGFSKANNAALLEAKQQMQEATKSLWKDIADIYNYEGAYSQTVDGVEDAPIDFPEFKADKGFI